MLLREPVQPTPLDLAPKASLYTLTPLIALVMTSGTVFFVTLLIGVWAAYDLATALIRFAVIATGLATMIGIVWAGRYHAKTILGLVGVVCALGAAGISIAYGLRFTHNSGAVASGLMVLLPLAICGVWWQWVSHENRLLWPAGGAVVIALVTFLLTSERTAWIGLGIGVLGAGYIDRRSGAPNSSDSVMRRASDRVLGLGVLSGLVVYSVLFFTPTLDGIIG